MSNAAHLAAVEADLMPTLVQLRLDMQRTAFVGRKGDLTVFITDVDLGGRKKEPAILMVNRTDPVNRQFRWPLSRLWLLLNHEANRVVFQRAAALLYGFPTQMDEHRILDVLFDFADDLKNAKPVTPMTNQQWLQALAEDDMILTFDGAKRNA
jgi:hypothetical protein